MVQLNLMPDVKKEFLKTQRNKATVIGVCILVTGVSLGITALFAAWVYGAQALRLSIIQGNIDERIAAMKEVDDVDKYLTLQNQLNSLPALHRKTRAYSRLFDYLKILNPASPNSVRLSTLHINNKANTISMNGTTGSFKSFAVFKDTLVNAELIFKTRDNKKQTTQLFVENGIQVRQQALSKRGNNQIVTFALIATYNPKVFAPGIHGIKLKIPNINTTQPLTNAPDRDVFQKHAKEKGNK